MASSKRRCIGRWPEYTSYSQHTAHIESILVLLRVLAVLAVPAFAVPTGLNTVSIWQYPQYRSLKYLKYGNIPQAEYGTVVMNPKCYEYGTIRSTQSRNK